MTKGELVNALIGFPDDQPIWFNISSKDDHWYDWETNNVEFMLDKYLCPRCEGLHEEPLMYYDIVFMVGPMKKNKE